MLLKQHPSQGESQEVDGKQPYILRICFFPVNWVKVVSCIYEEKEPFSLSHSKKAELIFIYKTYPYSKFEGFLLEFNKITKTTRTTKPAPIQAYFNFPAKLKGLSNPGGEPSF